MYGALVAKRLLILWLNIFVIEMHVRDMFTLHYAIAESRSNKQLESLNYGHKVADRFWSDHNGLTLLTVFTRYISVKDSETWGIHFLLLEGNVLWRLRNPETCVNRLNHVKWKPLKTCYGIQDANFFCRLKKQARLWTTFSVLPLNYRWGLCPSLQKLASPNM